jgi:hypothetical protein
LLLLALVASVLPSRVAAPQDASPPRRVTLRFVGPVDGSDRIEIRNDGARWTSDHCGLPEGAASLNGVRWEPCVEPWLDNAGAQQFLREPVAFRDAELRRLGGRDTVLLERFDDHVVVRIADTPHGAGWYEFELRFAPAGTSAELLVEAPVDGSDELRIDREGARWQNLHWSPPAEVALNGRHWHPAQQAFLPNRGETRFLPDGVEFATARVLAQDGRDTIGLENAGDHLLLRFADNPHGAARYSLRIRFGAAGEPR